MKLPKRGFPLAASPGGASTGTPELMWGPAVGVVALPGPRDRRVHRRQRLEQGHVAHGGGADAAPLLRYQRAEQPELAEPAQQLGRTALLVPRPGRHRGDLALGVAAAQVKQLALELGECEVHGPLALRSTLTGQYIIGT